MTVKIRNRHEPVIEARGDIDFTGTVSMTKQSESYETDINVIMSRYLETGNPLLLSSERVAQWGDVSGVKDFHSAVNLVKRAYDDFEALPAKVRSAFRNSPIEMLEAVLDVSRRDELVALGLIEKPPFVEPEAPAPPAPGAATPA